MASRSTTRRVILAAAVMAVAIATFCLVRFSHHSGTSEPVHWTAADTNIAAFDVHWPLRVPTGDGSPDAKSLLSGQLLVRPDATDRNAPCVHIQLEIIRADDEQHREFWNECLAYRRYRWMDRVRVWDEDHQWLYPNLTYLFKLHGIDRLRRYGGWDSGHQVDNDFGAVLIRKFDAAGTVGDPATQEAPLVSAGWHPVGIDQTDRQTVVHRIRSDEFTLHLSSGEDTQSGRLKVWFVYADFMEHPVPPDWPEQPEFNGGTMAFFHVDWRKHRGQSLEISIRQQTPPSTDFDWQKWTGRFEKSDKTAARPKLED